MPARRSCTRRMPSPRAAPPTSAIRPIEGTNVCHRFRLRHGDVEAGFAEADVVVEETFRTAGAQHGHMEPHACVAEWEGER